MRLKWLLFSAVFFLAIGLFLLQLFGPNSSVRVSPQTTAITSPLAADGLPNYAQALVDQQRVGVTRENNGAREFWQAMGPSELSAQYFDLLCKELDVPRVDPPVYLVDPTGKEVRARVGEWLESQTVPGSVLVLRDGLSTSPVEAPSVDGHHDALAYDLVQEAQRLPWAAGAFPPLAAWAIENDRPLNLLVAAAAKPRFFSPSPDFLEDPRSTLIEMRLPQMGGLRVAGRSLATRAAFRAGNKQYVEAWQDCLACWRLGAHAAEGSTLLERLIGMALRGVAKESTLMLLQCDDLPENVARQVLDDLNSLSPSVPIADAIDRAERFGYLDYVLRQFTGRLGGLGDRHGIGVLDKALDQASSVFAFEVEEPLRLGNQWYDRLAAAAAIGDLRTRRAEVDHIEAELTRLAATTKASLNGKFLLRGSRSEAMGNLLVCLALPGLGRRIEVVDRDATNMSLARAAAALAVFKARHGEYPAALDELAPDILSSAPLDPYDEKNPLHYERRGDGYLLYSVFENGADDGGSDYSGEIAQGEWLPADQSQVFSENADLVIRMPRPVRKLQAVKAASAGNDAVESESESIPEAEAE